jgi:hypothetical protein
MSAARGAPVTVGIDRAAGWTSPACGLHCLAM